MAEHDASIEVSGRMAQNVANSVLDSLGVEPEDVEFISVDLTTANGSETDTHFESDGHNAGVVAAQMLKAIDLEDAAPQSINVALDTVARDEQSEPDEEDGEEGDTGNGDAATSEPSDSGEDDDDSDYRRLTPGSNPHAALTAVAVYYTKVTSPGEGNPPTVPSVGNNGNRGVSAQELYRVVDTDLTERQLKVALRNAVLDNGVLSRDKAGDGKQNSENLYWVNELGRAYLGEEGGHRGVAGDYSGVLDDEQEDTAHPYSALRKAMAGQRHDVGSSKPGAGVVYEEPKRDDPWDVSENTRVHEVLWLLRDHHQGNGGEDTATAAEIWESDEFGFTAKAGVSSTLSEAFNNYHVVDRVEENPEGEQKRFAYKLNTRGWQVVQEYGKPDRA